MRTRRFARATAICAAGALALAVAAGPATASVGSAKAPACAGKTKKKAVKAIKQTWNTLFDGTGPATLDEKAAAIEGTEDPAFKQTFNDIAAKNQALLTTIKPNVTAVQCTGKKAASVTFDLVSATDATPILPAQAGDAVLLGKEWKASKATICDLFGLADPNLLASGPCATG